MGLKFTRAYKRTANQLAGLRDAKGQVEVKKVPIDLTEEVKWLNPLSKMACTRARLG
jgi:hypothetical protein